MTDIIEEVVRMPIKGGAIEFRGKVDLVQGDTLIDWKTTTDPEAYIDQQVVGYQAEMYALALREAGHTINRVVYRLIKKPSIRMCKKDATSAAYRARCVDWLRETPGALMEYEHYITDARMAQALAKIEDTAWEVTQSRERGYWRQNELACKDYARRCPFVGLCEGTQTTYAYDIATDRHEELGDAGAGDTVTPSSIKAYNQCAARYYWRYERRLRKPHEETSDALYTGTLVHLGLELLWSGKALDNALAAVIEAGYETLVIGEDAAKRQQQQTAQAAAMVQVGSEKWL